MKLFNFLRRKEDDCDLNCIMDMNIPSVNPYHKKRIMEIIDKLYINYTNGNTAHNSYMTPKRQTMIYKMENCNLIEKELMEALKYLMEDLDINGKIVAVTELPILKKEDRKFN